MADEEKDDVRVAVEKPRKRWVGILVALVFTASSGVAGTLLGPRFFKSADSKGAAKASGTKDQKHGEDTETPPENPKELHPIVVDVRDAEGNIHHMKVGLTIELAATVTKEEFEKILPRGREAGIAYLRTRTFDQLTDPAMFTRVTKELNEHIIKALGKKKAHRVVITDYVAQ